MLVRAWPVTMYDYVDMHQNTRRFSAGTETLEAISIGDSPTSSGIVFLHGAGKATKERALPLAKRLATAYGINSFLFDFSGHGASTGRMDDSSLAKRLAEAKTAIRESGFEPPVSFCAFSMGGHIALELLKDTAVRGLALFYPAIYAADAVHLQFNEVFSAKIREPLSWAHNDVVPALESFRGSLLLVRGSEDTVIPSGVIDTIRAAARNTESFREIVIKDAPHLVLPTVYDHPDLFEDICSTIAEYCGPTSGNPRLA